MRLGLVDVGKTAYQLSLTEQVLKITLGQVSELSRSSNGKAEAGQYSTLSIVTVFDMLQVAKPQNHAHGEDE